MDPATGILAAVNITLAIFVLGLAYSAGKNVNRIDNLERTVNRIETAFKELADSVNSNVRDIHGHIHRVEQLVKGHKVHD